MRKGQSQDRRLEQSRPERLAYGKGSTNWSFAGQGLGLSALVFEQSPYSPADRLSPARRSLRERRSVKSAPGVSTRRPYHRRPQGHAAIRAGNDKNPGAGRQRADRRDGLDVNARQRVVASGAPRESGHLPRSPVVEVEKGPPARRPPVLAGETERLASAPPRQTNNCVHHLMYVMKCDNLRPVRPRALGIN